MAKTKEDEKTAVTIPSAVETMLTELQEWARGQEDDRSPEQISLDIVEQILSSEWDQLGGATTDVSGLMEIPLLINLRSWVPSDIGEFGVFAVLECVDGFDLENKKIVTCGAKNVVAVLYKAAKEERFPFKGQFRGSETKQGYTALWLDPLPE